MLKRAHQLLLVLIAIFLTIDIAAAIEDPQLLVKQTADGVLAEIIGKEESLRKDQRLIYALVEAQVVPHFDFKRMSQSAMGRFWRKATDDQKLRIEHQFQRLLVRTYAVALLSYSGEQIEYKPVRTDAKTGRVMVPTRIKNSQGPSIPIDYRLYQQDGAWKVYDVVIDGVSLITNYRSSFKSQIRRGGIEGLISRLEAQNYKSNG